MSRVLVIAPHMDDEVLGLGATIARHSQEGDEVHVCIVANRAYGHEYKEHLIETERNAAIQAREFLGYEQLSFLELPDERLDQHFVDVVVGLEKQVSTIEPDVVYLNHRGSVHQDHQAVFRAGIIACRPVSQPKVKRLLCYEVPSSDDQATWFASVAFRPNYYVNVESHIEAKIRALEAYSREVREFPHPRSSEGVLTLAKKRGSEIGFLFAEAFEILREEWA